MPPDARPSGTAIALDPQARFILDMLAQAKRIPYGEITPPQARAQYLELCRRTQSTAAHGVAASDHELPGGAGPVRCRLYRPEGAGAAALPVLVFFHGGGWCIGDLETHDQACRRIAAAAACAVLAVDYRLAPEHRFPAAVEDCFAVLRHVGRAGASLGLDPARVAVGGDSAGGNLAAVCALLARDAGFGLRFQFLIYPGTDFLGDYASRRRFAEGFLLTREAIEWFSGNYVGSEQWSDWRASPVRAPDLSGLPPALIVIGACDPLLDEGLAYARRLAEAGTDVACHVYPGMIHGFLTMGAVIGAADRLVAEGAAALRTAFASEPG